MISARKTILTALLVAVLTGTASAASVKDRFNKADAAYADKNYADAVTLYTALGDDPKVQLDDRIRAYSKVVDAERAQKHTDNVLAAYGKLFALQMDDARRKDLTMGAASYYNSVGHLDQAVAMLNELAAKYPDDDEINTDAHLAAANYLTLAKKPAAVAEQLTLALKYLDPDDPRTAGVIWNLCEAQWSDEKFDQSMQSARKLTDERYDQSPRYVSREAHNRVIAALLKLKKADDAVAQLREWEKSDPSEVWRQRWAVRVAQTIQGTGNADAAMAAYRNLFVQHAQAASIDGWYEAQTAIVDRLTASNDLAGALKAAHILLDASTDLSTQAATVQRISDLLQKLDGKKTRAKAFIAFQIYGPAGKDGNAGTADDPQDPLKTVGYPEDPEREKAFAAAFAAAGDDAAATYHRAMLCIYLGRPQEAVSLYLDALRRASSEDWPIFANGLIVNGLRSARGTGVGTDTAAKFLLNGPADADGKAADPFAAIAAKPKWPQPALSDADRASITTLQASLRSTVLDDSLPGALRQSAIRALLRTNEAADTQEKIDPFVELAGDADKAVSDAAVGAVLKIARGNEIHLGKLREFLATDPLPAGAAKKADAEVKKYSAALKALAGKNAGVPKVAPIKD